jgi:hypothetical protein
MVWGISLLPTKLIPRRLTPVDRTNGIRSLIGVGKLVGPLTHSVLYLRSTAIEAIPKYISGRTSYHQV